MPSKSVRTKTTTSTIVGVRAAVATLAVTAVAIAVSSIYAQYVIYSQVTAVSYGLLSQLPPYPYPSADFSKAKFHVADNHRGARVMENIGDINGDGKEDLAIGDHSADVNTVASAGKVYIFLGRSVASSTAGQVFSHADADFTIEGVSESTEIGLHIGSLADLDSDGKDDFFVASSGMTYIFMGNQFTGTKTVQVSGARYSVRVSADFFDGEAVFSGGDINGDGKHDLLFLVENEIDVLFTSTLLASSAPEFTLMTWQDCYISLGGFQNNIPNELMVERTTGYPEYGVSVGDINNDNHDDIAIITRVASENDDKRLRIVSGAACAEPGPAGSQGATIEEWNSLFTLALDANASFVSIAGDVNGGGRKDLVVQSDFTNAQGATQSSLATFLMEGRGLMNATSAQTPVLSASNVQISAADGRIDYTTEIQDFWTAGDINNDGADDILIRSKDDSYEVADTFLSKTNFPTLRTTSNIDFRAYAQAAPLNYGGLVTALDFEGDDEDDLFVLADDTSGNTHVYGIIRIDCIPSTEIYVSVTGKAGAEGGPDCPVATINEGIQKAVSVNLRDVKVLPGVYSEIVALKPRIRLHGVSSKSTHLPESSVHAVIASPRSSTGVLSQDYIVVGANESEFKYFEVRGPVLLEGVSNMVIEENIIKNSLPYNKPTVLLSNSKTNSLLHNIIIRDFSTRIPAANRNVVEIRSTSGGNSLRQNVIHAYFKSTTSGETRGVLFDETSPGNTLRNNAVIGTRAGGTNTGNFSLHSAKSGVAQQIHYNFLQGKRYNILVGSGNVLTGSHGFTAPYPKTLFDYRLLSISRLLNTGDPGVKDLNGSRSDIGVMGGGIKFDLQPAQ